MLWGGRWEGGSCLGTHVRIKDFKIKKKNKERKKEIPRLKVKICHCQITYPPTIVVLGKF